MELNEKKVLMGKYGDKLESAIKREAGIRKEIENDKALARHLEAQKATGTPFENPVYDSYDEWLETIAKQIKKSENSLANIEFKKVELEAIRLYTSQN